MWRIIIISADQKITNHNGRQAVTVATATSSELKVRYISAFKLLKTLLLLSSLRVRRHVDFLFFWGVYLHQTSCLLNQTATQGHKPQDDH